MRHSRRPSASRSPEFRQPDRAASAAQSAATPQATAESAAPDAAAGDIVVFRVRQDTACSECHEELGRARIEEPPLPLGRAMKGTRCSRALIRC